MSRHALTNAVLRSPPRRAATTRCSTALDPVGRRAAGVVCGPAGAGADRWLAASSSPFLLAMLPFPQEWSGRGGDRANARGKAPDSGLVHAAIRLRRVLCS